MPSETYRSEVPWYWELAYILEILIFVVPMLAVTAVFYIWFRLAELGRPPADADRGEDDA